MRPTLAALALLACLGCGNAQVKVPVQQATDPLTYLDHDFGTYDLAGGQEVSNWCQSWTLHNPEELWVNAVELNNDGYYHHSNWFYVADNVYDVPDGSWVCSHPPSGAPFDEVTAALAGGVLYAQSTQVKHEVQKFPEGAVLRIPPWSRIVGSTHLLNYSTQPFTTGLRMRIGSLPKDQATVKLTPFRLQYSDLQIPPHAHSHFTGTCSMSSTYQNVIGPLPMQPFSIFYLLPHTHALGYNLSVQVVGGAHDGETLISATTNNREANGKAFDPPLDLSDATAFTFTCSYDNPRDDVVRWGIGDQEMCELLGYAASPMLFDAEVNSGSRMAGGTDQDQTFSGPCDILGVRAIFNQAGGPPR